MFKRGEVYYTDLPMGNGSVQGGVRPVVIIQNNIGNKYSPTVIVAGLTSKNKKRMPTHVELSKNIGLDMDSKVLAEQIFTLNKTDLIGRPVCILPNNSMKQVDVALTISLALDLNESDEKKMENMFNSIKNNEKMFTMFVKYCKTSNMSLHSVV